MLDYNIIIILIITGFSGGIIVGIGSGTIGVLLLPILTIFIGKNIHKSIGTTLLIDGIIGAFAGLIFLKKGNINLKSGILLAITGVIGALIGSQFTSFTPEGGLMLIIGIVILLLGLNFLINGIGKNVEFIQSRLNIEWIKKNKNISFFILGLIIGIVSGFTGIGGGGFIAIVLILILGYEIHIAVGTSLLMMFFMAGAGSLGHIFKGEILYEYLVYLIFAAALGASIGSFFANKINEEKLGRVIGLVYMIMGIAVIIRILYS